MYSMIDYMSDNNLNVVACWEEGSPTIIELVPLDLFKSCAFYRTLKNRPATDDEVKMYETGKRIYKISVDNI